MGLYTTRLAKTFHGWPTALGTYLEADSCRDGILRCTPAVVDKENNCFVVGIVDAESAKPATGVISTRWSSRMNGPKPTL